MINGAHCEGQMRSRTDSGPNKWAHFTVEKIISIENNSTLENPISSYEAYASSSSLAHKWPLLTKGVFSHGEGLSINHTTLDQCGLAISNLKLEIINPGFPTMFSFTRVPKSMFPDGYNLGVFKARFYIAYGQTYFIVGRIITYHQNTTIQ
uniref:SFRICE_013791 n=1 Tax=Spodoptera frugiperda TaxID=7108 RepID=A0A2H1VM82_SPOFR